jgi:hypothetical protein
MRCISYAVLAAYFASVICAQTPENQLPSTMLKMEVRLIGPGIKPRSHAALPRRIYRAGAHYARIEDPPDARQQMQKLVIIAEPGAYSVNLIDRTGTHAVDQGGPNDLHLPVVLPFDPKHNLPKLDRLEFGKELAFFKDAGAIKDAGPIINAKLTDAYRLSTDGGSATIVVRSGTDVPIKLSWHTAEGTYTYEYIVYQTVPFDASLFTKPAGIRFKEIPPDAAPDGR